MSWRKRMAGRGRRVVDEGIEEKKGEGRKGGEKEWKYECGVWRVYVGTGSRGGR